MEKPDLEQMVKSLMVSSDQNSSTQSQTTPKQQTFSDHERDVTGYLFAKLIVLYANSFYLVYPSEKEVQFAKREYAKQIGLYSRDQIDIAIKLLAGLAISTERENRIFREPNIPAILALMDEAVKRDRAHQLFLPVKQETEEEKSARLELGKQEAAKLLAMFPEDPPKEKTLTPEEILDKQKLERLKSE